MANRNKWLILFLGAVIFSLVIGNLIQNQIKKNWPTINENTESITLTPTESEKVQVKVTRVIDGDTIEIEGGQKVRYIGIDTPETVAPNKPVGCFGKEASAKNKELVEGKMVELEKDVSETDKYGRLLRYVYVEEEMVNEILIKDGFARLDTVPPDIKYSEKLKNDETAAWEYSRGLWNECLK